jgi:hypothetical protein
MRVRAWAALISLALLAGPGVAALAPAQQKEVSSSASPVIWWNNLERILLAVEDLGCRDLLL